MTLLGITAQCESGAIVRLQVAGEVDMSSAGQLVSAARAAITAAQVQAVLIDMAGTGFLDAAGITALLVVRRAAAEHGISLRVVNSHGIVRRVLSIVDVLPLLEGTNPRRH